MLSTPRRTASPIEDELLSPDATGGLDDERVSASPVVTVAGEKGERGPHSRDNETEAVLVDLVDPAMGISRPEASFNILKQCSGKLIGTVKAELG